MGIGRVEMIVPLFYVKAQENNVRTDRSPPRFMCIVLDQFAKLNDNRAFTQVQNCRQKRNGCSTCRSVPPPFLCVNTGTSCLDPS